MEVFLEQYVIADRIQRKENARAIWEDMLAAIQFQITDKELFFVYIGRCHSHGVAFNFLRMADA